MAAIARDPCAPLDPAEGAARASRRGCTHRRHHRAASQSGRYGYRRITGLLREAD